MVEPAIADSPGRYRSRSPVWRKLADNFSRNIGRSVNPEELIRRRDEIAVHVDQHFQQCALGMIG
jgi:hypothetical protein